MSMPDNPSKAPHPLAQPAGALGGYARWNIFLQRYFCAFLLVWAGSCLAQEAPAPAARHCLWRIQGQRNTLYLLGSIHVLKRSHYPLADPIEAAFTNSQVVAFETDFAKMEKPSLQDHLADQARLPAGVSLRDVLAPDTFARFQQEVKEAGLSPAVFEHTKPGVAAITLEIFALKKLGFDPEYGVDRYFFDRARNQRKEIRWFESVEFQIRLLTDMARSEEDLMVKTTLEDIDETRKLFGEMLRAWETGDTRRMEEMLLYSMRQSPALFQRLLTDRNRRWVPRLQQWLKEDRNVLVVVGAGHLVGKDGVVELLRAQGLKVEQQ